ncbi:hypothetical protein GBAR_LOCUS16853, partial [Geodia barretti]
SSPYGFCCCQTPHQSFSKGNLRELYGIFQEGEDVFVAIFFCQRCRISYMIIKSIILIVEFSNQQFDNRYLTTIHSRMK